MDASAAIEGLDKSGILTALLGHHPMYALAMIMLGLIGGTISGFIGSGGAFLMTPGMMNLGVPGIMAVGANITHKFGKAMMGQRAHGHLGHVDRPLGLLLLITSLAGIRIAVVVNSHFFETMGKDGSDLYVSCFFVATLSIVGAFITRDAVRNLRHGASAPSQRFLQVFKKVNFRPVIYFRTANVHVPVIPLAVVGFAIGYMAGTIGVGGFIGVPALIYLFGVPTVVATGTELFLAMFMGAFGALNYGYEGYVDVRITLLLFVGSMVGLFIGSIGTKLVREVYIRTVTGILVLLCALSRAIAIPIYLRALHIFHFSNHFVNQLHTISAIILFGSGILSTTFILCLVFSAHRRQIRLLRKYEVSAEGESVLPAGGTSLAKP